MPQVLHQSFPSSRMGLAGYRQRSLDVAPLHTTRHKAWFGLLLCLPVALFQHRRLSHMPPSPLLLSGQQPLVESYFFSSLFIFRVNFNQRDTPPFSPPTLPPFSCISSFVIIWLRLLPSRKAYPKQALALLCFVRHFDLFLLIEFFLSHQLLHRHFKCIGYCNKCFKAWLGGVLVTHLEIVA